MFIHCGTVLPRISWSKRPISGPSRFCSKQRHTARQHLIEGRIYYPFHPRCGEIVLIVRQYAYRGAELVVIPQPDGSIACIPAWMTHELAAHHQLRTEPRFSLDVLRSVRSEIDALLGFLQSDSRMEKAAPFSIGASGWSVSLRQPAGRYGGASEMRPQPVTAAAPRPLQ